MVGAMLLASSAAWGQPQIFSLGSGGPNSVTQNVNGTHYVGGAGITAAAAGRWALTGNVLTAGDIGGTGGGLVSADGAFSALTVLNVNPQVSGNSATNVSPPFRLDPPLTPVPLATTEGRGARWEAASNTFMQLPGLPIVPELMVFGSGSSGGSTGNFISPNAISQTGRFIVGLGYISSYNSAAGTTISANTFQWRPWIWDAQANGGQGAYTVLPTPFRTSTNTWRRRTGNAYGVSNDGSVIVGAQEHNVGAGPAADPDGGRPVVWRLNTGSGQYEMSYLPNGTNESGFPYTYSTTPGTFFINGEGTLIVGRAVDNAGALFVGKWVWNAKTSTWNAPINLGSGLAAPASWLPEAVTSCGVPPTITPTGMSQDGTTVVGIATYSTCGSFMSGGFIWTADSNTMSDWYDWLSEAAGNTVFENYGPIGDNGDPNRGLPRLGYPTAISLDGNAIVGLQGGTQRIIGAVPTMVLRSGGPGCVAPLVTSNPVATYNYTACTSSIILNSAVAGTLPIGVQWQKNGDNLVDGPSASGSTIAGATTTQLRVNQLLSPADAGSYHLVATGVCGKPITTTNATVQVDPALVIAPNDTCATAQVVTAGTNVLNPAQSPCAAMVNDPVNGASCFPGGTRADRWFVFTPDQTGAYRIETCGSNYDTVLSLFGDCNGFEIECNDNYTTGPTTGCASARSRILSVVLNAGTPYYIRLAAPLNAFLSDTATMNFSIIAAPPAAPNDFCTTATAATVGANAFSTNEATPDGNATCNSATAARDVWFTYTPSANGLLDLATCPGTSWNTVLTVFDNCFGNELACNDNANVTGCSQQSIISDLQVTGGATYYIRIGTNSNTAAGGDGVLTVGFEATCTADFNDDNFVNSQDFFDFLTAFFNLDITADFNHDSVINSQDFFDFLTAFFTGC
jgi:hypothetical protein